MSGFKGLGKRKAAGGGDENETKKSKYSDEEFALKVELKNLADKININDVLPTYADWNKIYKTTAKEGEPYRTCVIALDNLLEWNMEKNQKEKNIDIFNDLKKQAEENPTQYDLFFLLEMCSSRITKSNAELLLGKHEYFYIGETKIIGSLPQSHGEGFLLFPQCDGYYKGSFISDKRHGIGCEVFNNAIPNRIIRKEGTFSYDKLINGITTIIDTRLDGFKIMMEGEFNNSNFFKKGKITDIRNDKPDMMMEGCFIKDKLDGKGKVTYYKDSNHRNHSNYYAEGHFIKGVCKKPVWYNLETEKKVDGFGELVVMSFKDWKDNKDTKLKEKQIDEAFKEVKEFKSPEPTKSKKEIADDIRQRTPKGKQCEETCLNSPVKKSQKSHVRCKTPPNSSRDYSNTKHEKAMAKFYETHPERREHHRVTRLNAKKEEKRLLAEQKSKQKSKSKKP